MRATLPLAILLVFAAPHLAAQSPEFSAGGLIGFENGFGIQAFGTVRNLAQGLPAAIRLRLGRTGVNPGSASEARRIFINNATNGTPVSSGRTLDAGLDVVIPRGRRTQIYAGVRHSSFKGRFVYVGGNEDFDVTSSQWGLGGGIEGTFPMTRTMALVVSGGAEWFPPTSLYGHDTSYSPNGEDVNAREDFAYADADRAIGQPKLRPTIMLGLSYRFGVR